MKDVGNFTISADGKKLLVRKGGKTLAIIDAAKDQKLDKKKISLSGMNATIDPRAEWRQVFTEAWRIERDFFYDPNMHGVDWPAVREQYGAMLADCASREDVTFVIGEMIAEINVGHTYVRPGGDREKQPRVGVGMLGCDYARENGAYRITRIHEGAPWD
ncbi:MAG: peptidase S41, partial [Phycisphaerae bacterium]